MLQTDKVEDHRTRVGAQRRERTRNRLIETALAVFAEKGPDAPGIEDFIAAAGVARGTFYNYFRTTGELLGAVAGEISDEVLGVVDPLVLRVDDPAARVATGARLYMRMACRYPLWGAFITRVGIKLGSRGKLLDEYLTRDLKLAIEMRRFDISNVVVARDVVLGSTMCGIATMLAPDAPADYAEQVLFAQLRGFGLDREEARAIAYSPLPETPAPKGVIFSRIDAMTAARPSDVAQDARVALASTDV